MSVLVSAVVLVVLAAAFVATVLVTPLIWRYGREADGPAPSGGPRAASARQRKS